MSRALETAKSQQSNSGPIPPFVAGKNLLINGGFDFWQRGTTFNNAQTLDYTTDRWFAYNDLVNAMNVTRQDISSAGLGVRYAMRVERSSGTARWTMINLTEGALSLIGKTVTFSGYIRKGSAFTSQVNIDCGTRAVRYGPQYDGISTVVLSAASLSTTAWTKFSSTFNITTATSTNNADLFEIEITGASQAGAAGAYFEVAALQLEVGNQSTPFSRAGGTIQGELAACQRYYWRAVATNSPYNKFGIGMANSTTSVQSVIPLPVTMRTLPTSIDFSGLGAYDGGLYAISAVSFDGTSQNVGAIICTTPALTAGKPFIIIANANSNAYLGFSAEL
jgi:hypothetical protein